MLPFLPAIEQARLVRKREITALELVEVYLERIERLDPALNAFVTVCGDEALAEARSPRPGPFGGVPLPIKDLSDTAGIRTTYSCRAFADHVPSVDAEVVRRLRGAGFIFIGKTNTPEFGTTAITESPLNGDCRNPWDLARTPGGSSGGAAAAVAAGLASVAHASDGGGSIRIPASCCGLFGLKPSRGRISPAPYGDLFGFSAQGVVSRTVADTAALLDTISGPATGDQYIGPPLERPLLDEVAVDPGPLRVALIVEPPVAADVAPECVAAARDAAALLEELGHQVEEPSAEWTAEALFDDFRTVWQTIPTLYPVPDRALLDPMNAALAARADATSSVDYLLAYRDLQLYGRRFAEFCARFDLVLTPTLATSPVPVGWTRDSGDPLEAFDRIARFTPFTPAVNVAGLPAASVPLAWSDEGLPIGVQLIAGHAQERILLQVGAQLEQARPWADRRPELAAL